MPLLGNWSLALATRRSPSARRMWRRALRRWARWPARWGGSRRPPPPRSASTSRTTWTWRTRGKRRGRGETRHRSPSAPPRCAACSCTGRQCRRPRRRTSPPRRRARSFTRRPRPRPRARPTSRSECAGSITPRCGCTRYRLVHNPQIGVVFPSVTRCQTIRVLGLSSIVFADDLFYRRCNVQAERLSADPLLNCSL